jgi:hypothetical protein
MCGSLFIVDHEGQSALRKLSRFADAEITYFIENNGIYHGVHFLIS